METSDFWTKKRTMAMAMSMSLMTMGTMAQNPIIQTNYTADPAPAVFNDTVFLYTSHDDDAAEGFLMKNWLLYTSTDMVNWTDHGEVASLKTFSGWANQKNGAWALQCVKRNNKYYIYCPIQMQGIGVAVADSPYGPFKDALGKQLINNSMDDIDPTVYIDDDGQAYLYWGNPNLYHVKLNNDMISYSGDIVKCSIKPDDYQEAPWLMKHNGKYYMSYASTCCPEGIGYSMSDGPTGPWNRTGTIMDHNGKSSGNHPGIIDYKGKSYVFGFDYDLYKAKTHSDKHREQRCVCLAQFDYNADGTINELAFWDEQKVDAVGTVNPFNRVEAETMAWSEGLRTAKDEKTGMYVDSISNGDYIKVRSVDFGTTGAAMFQAHVACSDKGASIEVRLDSVAGKVIATLPVTDTAGEWKYKKTGVKSCTGVHDVCLVFKGNADKARLFKFDSWQFYHKKNKH